MKKCGKCTFWAYYRTREFGAKEGQCRYSPPHASYGWPRTDDTKWCGFFKEVI